MKSESNRNARKFLLKFVKKRQRAWLALLQKFLSSLKMKVGLIFLQKAISLLLILTPHMSIVLSQVKFKKIHEEALARMKAERAQQER